FLLVQCPNSSYPIMELLVGRSGYPLLFVVVCSEQLFAIICIHWLYVQVNQHFRQPNKRLHSLLIHHRSRLATRTNLKLSSHFQQFYTKKRYGFSYGNFGVLSLLSFFKASSEL